MLPHAPTKPPPAPSIDVDKLLTEAMAAVQHGLDLAMAAPRWTAIALLILAVALVLLGRHGQRLLAGTCFAALVVGFALLFLRAQAPNEDWPGLVAVIGGGAAFALGLAFPGWTTALLSAVTLGALGGLCAVKLLDAAWFAGALPFALLGIFLGLANHLFWGLWMPPIAAGAAFTVAAARLLGSQSNPASGPAHPAAIPLLTHADVALFTFAVFAVILIAVSLERDHLRKKRGANKSRQKADEELKAKMIRDRERHAKFLGNKS